MKDNLKKIGIGIIVIALVAIGVLQYRQEQRMGATIPTIPALFRTTLASKISSTATSMTLTTGTDKSGDTLSGYICYIIDEGTASEEFVCGTTAGTAVSSMIRGIDPIDGDEEVTSLKKAHRRGGIVKVTNYPQLGILSRILNGDETFPNKVTYSSAKTFTADQDIISKKYADDLAIAGAPDGTYTVKGLFELSTLAETILGTTTGGTSATMVVPTTFFNATSSATNIVPVTGSDGKLSQGFIDLSGSFVWTGAHSFSGSGDIDLPNDSVDAADINTITCGTNCTWDAANDEIDIDDVFVLTAGDEMAGNLTFDTTARTIAGIQNLNLLDKSASETITGLWDFSTSIPTLPASDPTTANQAARKSYVDTEAIDQADEVPRASASDVLQFSADTERNHNGATYTKKKEIRVDYGGVVRVKFDLKGTGGTGVGRIYVNGVATGTEQSASTTYETESEDISGLKQEDLVQLYIKTGTGSDTYVRNFRIYFDITLQRGEVITD